MTCRARCAGSRRTLLLKMKRTQVWHTQNEDYLSTVISKGSWLHDAVRLRDRAMMASIGLQGDPISGSACERRCIFRGSFWLTIDWQELISGCLRSFYPTRCSASDPQVCMSLWFFSTTTSHHCVPAKDVPQTRGCEC